MKLGKVKKDAVRQSRLVVRWIDGIPIKTCAFCRKDVDCRSYPAFKETKVACGDCVIKHAKCKTIRLAIARWKVGMLSRSDIRDQRLAAQIADTTHLTGSDESKSDFYAERDTSLREMGFETYASYLASDDWAKIKAGVIWSRGSVCRCCLASGTDVHHLDYSLATMRGLKASSLVVLCRRCHEWIEFRPDHEGKKRKIFDGRVIAERYDTLRKHWAIAGVTDMPFDPPASDVRPSTAFPLVTKGIERAAEAVANYTKTFEQVARSRPATWAGRTSTYGTDSNRGAERRFKANNYSMQLISGEMC
jgi:hypothetical protein